MNSPMRFAILGSALIGSLSLSGAVLADGVTPVPVERCTEVRASTRTEAYGYTHVVTVHNRCNKPVVCDVWTDVDPTPKVTLRVAPSESAEIVTRRGSPAREVSAGSQCRYE
jgi:hypothetical protein